MNAAILYYSRTGTTQAVAEALGKELGAQPMRLACRFYEGGWWRYLMAGYDSVTGRLPKIEIPTVSWSDYDLVVLGAPIWTSYPAAPLRSFLHSKPDLPQRVALVLTHGGHSPPQKAIDFTSGLLGRALAASLGLQQKQVLDRSCDHLIAAFVRELRSGKGAR